MEGWEEEYVSMFGEEGNGELKLWFGAVPLGHSRLKIWGCHSCGTGFSFGVSLIPGLGITTCCGCDPWAGGNKKRIMSDVIDVCLFKAGPHLC